MSATAKSSCRTCCFCNLTEDNELEYGKFHEYNGIFTHYYCLLLSSNMEQKGSDDEGILGFLTEDIQKELNRGKRLVCSYCKKIGATLGCCNVRCKRIFHFPCGLKAGSLHQYFGEFRSYCINHRPKQKIEAHILKQIKSLDNILCCICYDKVNPTDFVKSLWAPCCKKNAFFHRKCVQQLASSAGYFFKCPLCNNKQDFRNAMLEYGIFIPSQDASWELVPNAFEELLYRHDQCDAVKCLCPKGRKHVSSNAKWELILCRTCGSQGIHMACGQLKWANPVWDCTECTSILRNSKNNEDAKSDNISDDLSRDSDSDSDTDISVGTDFPMLRPSSSFSFKLSSNSSSLLDSTSDISLRPGPRSFKLQQQINKRLELTRDQQNDDKMKHIKVSQDTNALLKNDNEKNDKKEKSLTNKENNTQKEKQISNSDNSVTSHSIQKETDVITIESDDDNEVEIITLKQKTGLSALKQSTSQSSIPRVPLSKNKQLNTVKNSTSNLSAISSNLLEKDIVELHKSVASESKISNENKSIYLISEQFDVAALQESMPDVISNSNDLDNVDTVDTSPVMNIKITDVISLPPELFESVPDVTLHENSIDTTSPSTSKSLEKLVAYIAPSKRIYEGAINTGYSKKVKGDNYEKFSANDSVTFNYHINTFDASKENGKISSLKSNEVHKNKSSLNCTSANKLSNSYNNQKDNLLTQMSSHKMDDMRHTNQVAGNYLEDNATLLQVQQNSENPVVNGTYLPSSKCKNPLFFPLANVYDTTLNSNDTNSQDTKNKGNMHLTNIIMPMTNVINPQTIVVNQSVTFNGSMPVIANDNQMKMLDKNKVVLMREKMFANVSSPNDSSNNIFCDGDAGTCCPAEINSTGRKKTNPSTKSCGSVDSNNAAVESHNPVATRSVFPRITNNHSTCHQPRLIPQYMNLHDLKFRACKPDNVQMVLYDTFSVNIPIKNSKESKIRSANVTAQQELKESSYYAADEASSNAEYIDDIQTVEQQFKFSRSSKNENLVNDKTKYVIHGQDDTKENLDPIRSKMLSRNSTYNNSLVNDSGDTVTIHDSFCGETGNEIRLASSDTNLSALNRTICNKNVEDTVKDDIAFVSNDRNKILHGSWQDVQQHKQVSVQDMTPPCTEEKFVRFYKENNRIVHNIDFDFNIVKTNKNIEKILQDDMTVSTNQHKDNNIIDNDYIDDSQTMLQNGYKHLACTNVTRPKLSNIMFNEHSILNKQINKSDSEINQRLTFDENTVNRNSENNFKHNNSECCCKISIDLCRIQSLIDSKPELFVNQKCNVDDKWCKYKSQL
ncbi:G2/M phase-specific E3 ubiquitin-protein ligase [Camponotus floridanus]|uniref:G2/M phase-specific E3 ubiquitin-protein ligase n=1 Tax=Camponotus floridanus TaxID=104421 RepID=E2A233_CAMFO|nr:G2/M phase-specific E3 ubiquitin-protein ligase [Camponotus floridanus]